MAQSMNGLDQFEHDEINHSEFGSCHVVVGAKLSNEGGKTFDSFVNDLILWLACETHADESALTEDVITHNHVKLLYFSLFCGSLSEKCGSPSIADISGNSLGLGEL